MNSQIHKRKKICLTGLVIMQRLYVLLSIQIMLIYSYSPVISAFDAQGDESDLADFSFTSQDCLGWANESEVHVGNLFFGGEGLSSPQLNHEADLSDFYWIETQQDFFSLLRQSNNQLLSETKLYFPNDIRINLTGYYGIVIHDDVTLLGSRGLSGKIGANFFTNDFADETNYTLQKPIFLVKGNNVTISGLIFSGPSPVGDIGDFDWKQGRFGIEIKHDVGIAESYIHITNNEFYGFGHAGISVETTFTTDIQYPNVIIEHNYIHDQMQFQSGRSGTGYGIVVNNAYPLIKHNEFGLNRHDVAHTGYFHLNSSSHLSGYELAFNLLHLGATDHMVDIHCYGTENSSNCEDYAGDFLYVHHNLFFDRQVGVAIRGAPTIGACLHDNYVIGTEDGFIERKSSFGNFGNVVLYQNFFNQSNTYVLPDADGDGIGDRSDPDDDNDQVPDSIDQFPFDPSESIDTDLDGIGNNEDTDDDGDLVADWDDSFPFDPFESIDTDLDGVGDNEDTDDDGDLVADWDDAFPLDSTRSKQDGLDVKPLTDLLGQATLLSFFILLLLVLLYLQSRDLEKTT